MRTDLKWSYTQAGGMNTANALGYLAGALAAAITTAAIGERRTFALSFTLTATSILASGFTTSYVLLLLLRGLGGAAGAVLFISGGALAAPVANPSRSPGLVLGVSFALVSPRCGFSGFRMGVRLAARPGQWRPRACGPAGGCDGWRGVPAGL